LGIDFIIELVSGVMFELGYTQAVDVKLVADSQDNRKGHHGEYNNIYLNDANLNNTKDLATTLGHETSHAIHNPDCCYQQAFDFSVFLLVCCLSCYY
jgi:hypothetical protein